MAITLSETSQLKLQYEFEVVTLIDKFSGLVLMEDEFYGDPECGLIDENNQWAIVGGNHLNLWTPQNFIRIIDKELQWIYDLRIKNSDIVEVLTDPWNEKSAIWELNVRTGAYKKVKPFKDYFNKPYTEQIDWN